ncbi:MAG: cohesin domain-containing protein [bacterium]
MKKLLTLIMSLGIVMSYSFCSFAWTHNEHNKNKTGATAYDVVKILDGDYEVTEMAEWDFHSHTYYHRSVGGKMQTVLRWWNGAVPPNDYGDCCFTVRSLPSGQYAYDAKILAAWWTDENGIPLGSYIPTVSTRVEFFPLEDGLFRPRIALGNYQAARIAVNRDNPNRWADGDYQLQGEAAPVTIHGVYVGVVDGALDPYTLTIENTIKGPDASLYSFFDVFTSSADGTVRANTTLAYNQATPAKDVDQVLTAGQSLVIVVDLGDGQYDLFNFEAPELCAQCIMGDDGNLDIGNGKGSIGDQVTVPVRIHNTPNQVYSFGFDLVFNPHVLELVKVEKGPLTQPFNFFEGVLVEPGRGRIGGFDQGGIAAGTDGDIAYVTFLIIGGQENCSYPLRPTALKDDIANWSASGGCVTIFPPCNGDVNGDGAVTPADAKLTFKCYLGTGECTRCMDANEDGEVTPADALCIFRKYLGIPSCLDPIPVATLDATTAADATITAGSTTDASATASTSGTLAHGTLPLWWF